MSKKAKAQEAYQLASDEVDTLIVMLSCKVQDHQKSCASGKVHWGHVGDMNHIKQQLLDLLGEGAEEELEERMTPPEEPCALCGETNCPGCTNDTLACGACGALIDEDEIKMYQKSLGSNTPDDRLPEICCNCAGMR